MDGIEARRYAEDGFEAGRLWEEVVFVCLVSFFFGGFCSCFSRCFWFGRCLVLFVFFCVLKFYRVLGFVEVESR